MPGRLVDRRPEVSAETLVAQLVPPPRFESVRFETYLPDPAQPTQTAAVAAVRAFAERTADGSDRRRGWLRRRAAPPEDRPGLYLDGGFGVGKTHLLASLWHASALAVRQRLFCTFVELTNLAGALGFAQTVEELSRSRLVCVDEFELDDPGDTVLVATLLGRLADAGVRFAATSNTLPGRLGEGRFAAQDFLREIHSLSARFDVVRIDGEDYRHRGLPVARVPVGDAQLVAMAETTGGTVDEFDELCRHLASVHPRATDRWSTGSLACTSSMFTPSMTRPQRCGWSSSPTGSTTATSRLWQVAFRWTNCSRRSCWLAATARSTCGRSLDS